MRTGLTLAFSSRTRGPHIGRLVRYLKQSSGLKQIEVLLQINPGKYSLSQVYNHFLHQASYPILCLVHDDIVFQRTSHWGQQVIRAFQNHPVAAVLSPAGSISLEKHGIYWLPSEEMLGAVQHHLNKRIINSEYSKAPASALPALVLDGLFLALHRERLSSEFNETMNGFHFYDIDFSLKQSLAHLKHKSGQCLVLPELGIIHKSGGQTGIAFEKSRQKFIQQNAQLLPWRLKPELLLKPNRENVYTPIQAHVGCLILHSEPVSQTLEPQIDLTSLSQDLSSIKPIHLATALTPENEPETQRQLRQWSLEHTLDYLLILDHRVQPLQRWIPRLLKHFKQHPRLGTLGVRLHYADSHLLLHNGMHIYRHQGKYDVIYRGIHQAYAYRNQLEFDCLGTPAFALMLKTKHFFDWGGLGQQSWIPGLELNLNALKTGYINAVDSTLAGYWHDDNHPPHTDEYTLFLDYLQDWMANHGQHATLQARVQRF